MPYVSKSGPLRSQIGLAKRRAIDLIANNKNLENTVFPSDVTQAAIAIVQMENTITKLDNVIGQLEQHLLAWTHILEVLETSSEKHEEEMEFFLEKAEGEDGFLQITEETRELAAVLRAKIDSHSKQQSRPPGGAPSGSTTASAKGHGCDDDDHFKFRRRELPRCDGSLLSWQPFWTIFKTHVHDKSSPPTTKLMLLLDQLDGAAKEAVKGLPVMDNSYQTAVDTLKEQFDHPPEKIRSALYAQLRKLKATSDSRDIASIRTLYNDAECILRQLKSVNEDVDANHVLSQEILGKHAHHTIRQLFERFGVTSQSNVTEIQKALRRYVEENESINQYFNDLSPFGGESGSKPKKPNEHQQASGGVNLKSPPPGHGRSGQGTNSMTFQAGGIGKQEKPKWDKSKSGFGKSDDKPGRPCLFCGQDHWASVCQKYQSVDDRTKRLVELNRCTRCYAGNHVAKDCNTPGHRMRCSNCCNKAGVVAHKLAMCPKPRTATKSQTMITMAHEQAPDKVDLKGSAPTSCYVSLTEDSMMCTAVTTIRNPKTGKSKKIRLLLDSASQRCWCLEALAEELGVTEPRNHAVNVATFGTKRIVNTKTSFATLQLDTLDPANPVEITLNTTPMIANCSMIPENLPVHVKRQIEGMKHVLADDYSSDMGVPAVLIGVDYYFKFMSGIPMPIIDDLYAIPSSFGIVLGGRYQVDKMDTSKSVPTLLCLTETTSEVNHTSPLHVIGAESKIKLPSPDVDDFWDLERIGISDCPYEKDDEEGVALFIESLVLKDARYHMNWLWRKGKKQFLKSNYHLAKGRLRSLAKRLKEGDNSALTEYQKVLQFQLLKGIIEEVPSTELVNTVNSVHYLAHHPIVKIDHLTTKLRIVFDASARCGKDSLSLNECLYRGPVILPDLCSILMRFRQPKIAIIADVEKAFLQLGLHPSERDVTRFMWFRDLESLDADNIVTYRFTRVPFGIVCSPYLLAATLQHHLKSVGTPVAKSLIPNIYVDNVITGVENIPDAKELYQQSKQIFNQCSMNLREFTSNMDEFMDNIPEADKRVDPIIKVLGLDWLREKDKLKLHGKWSVEQTCNSKRMVLAAIASIFDPLGLFQPATLHAKMFLRDLWNLELGWDEKFDGSLLEDWQRLRREICPIFDIQFPRHLANSSDESNTCIMAFADASGNAYATSVYLRTKSPELPETWVSNLIYAKSRLAPKSLSKENAITLPRLELLGLTIAVRAAKFARSSLGMSHDVKIHCFSDAMIVIGWVKSNKHLPVFVANRVKQIRMLENAQIHHVPTGDNASDVCTRGLTGEELKASSLWWYGPEWFKRSEDHWPVSTRTETCFTDALRAAAGECCSNVGCRSSFCRGGSPGRCRTPLRNQHQQEIII